MYAVDGILHLLVIALAGNFNLLSQVAAADLKENPVAFADGQQNGIEHFVDVRHDARKSALELFGLSAFREQSFTGCHGQFANFLLQPLQNASHIIDRQLHFLVVAAVGVRDHFVDLAGADLCQNAVAFADGQQDCIEHLVHALDHFAITPIEQLRPSALGQAAVIRSLNQSSYLFLKPIIILAG